jgi:YidC/Oxa1 family membrane protein insertase
MSGIFNTILYQPLFNLFVSLYNIIPDVGIVILIVTLLVKLALYPLTSKSIKAQKSLTELQPKLEALKKQHKDNQQMLAQETMKLYREHKVNPFGSCLPLLIQIPVFLALYWVLQRGLTSQDFSQLYSFVKSPGTINTITLGFIDLKNSSVILALLAGAAQYWQSKTMMTKSPPKNAGEGSRDENMMTMMNKQMLYIFPIMTVIIGVNLPAGLSLYWFFSTVLTALQQHFIFKKHSKDNDENNSGTSTKIASKDVIEGKIIE